MNTEQRLIDSLGIPVVIENLTTKKGILHSIVLGSGEDLVLLHGINIGWGEWYPILAELAKHFKVHALDLPGAGGSVKPDLASKEFGRDVVSIIDEYLDAKKFKKVHLMGHSFGAWIALKLMIEQRTEIDRVVLISPVGFTAKTPARYRMIGSKLLAVIMAKTVMRPTRKNIKIFLTDVFYDKQKTLAPEFIDYYHEALAAGGVIHPFIFMNRLAGVFKVRDEFNLIQRIDKISRPVMIVIGENDPIVSKNSLRHNISAKLPHAAIRILARSGHVPFVEHPSLFTHLVIDFLTA